MARKIWWYISPRFSKKNLFEGCLLSNSIHNGKIYKFFNMCEILILLQLQCQKIRKICNNYDKCIPTLDGIIPNLSGNITFVFLLWVTMLPKYTVATVSLLIEEKLSKLMKFLSVSYPSRNRFFWILFSFQLINVTLPELKSICARELTLNQKLGMLLCHFHTWIL